MKGNTTTPCSMSPYSELFLNDIDFLDSLKEIHFNFIPLLFDSPLNSNVNANDNPMNNSEASPYTGVVNLSSHTLTDGELSLLSKGLTFVKTPPKPHIGKISANSILASKEN